MKSPLSRHRSETGPSAELALRPAVKLMFASATLLVGFSAAAAYWNGTGFDDSFFVHHEQVDKKLLNAPLPTPLLAAAIPICTEPIPERQTTGQTAGQTAGQTTEGQKALELPTIYALKPSPGYDKYGQAYPAPVLVPDKALEEEAKKNVPIAPVNYMSEKKLMISEQDLAPLHSFESLTVQPVLANVDQLSREPLQLDFVRESDALLSEFREIENMKVLMMKQETAPQPINPFATDLVPLQPKAEESAAKLVPLQPRQALVPLQP